MEVYSDRLKCTGCYACVNICPEHCIEMILDEEGFRYPVVDEEKCINCGLCSKICPIDKEIVRAGVLKKPKAYACYNKDDEVRERSATGGIAYTMSEYIVNSGGVVFGVVGSCIDRIYHTKAECIDDVKKMCNSKYLQSDVGMTFRETKHQLELGKEVLYTGTPCQIAGLYAFLGKAYDNLFTADLICHGVPSEMVFQKYVSELEELLSSKIIDVYRDKSPGWKPVHFTYAYANGKVVTESAAKKTYNRGFIINLFQRHSCYTCKYASIPRVADISLGDYFGGEKYKLHDTENKGLSLITVNTEKGKAMFEKIKGNLFYQEYGIEEVTNESEHLANPPRYNVLRKTFFKIIKKKTYNEAATILLPIRFWPRIRKKLILELCRIRGD